MYTIFCALHFLAILSIFNYYFYNYSIFVRDRYAHDLEDMNIKFSLKG